MLNAKQFLEPLKLPLPIDDWNSWSKQTQIFFRTFFSCDSIIVRQNRESNKSLKNAFLDTSRLHQKFSDLC